MAHWALVLFFYIPNFDSNRFSAMIFHPKILLISGDLSWFQTDLWASECTVFTVWATCPRPSNWQCTPYPVLSALSHFSRPLGDGFFSLFVLIFLSRNRKNLKNPWLLTCLYPVRQPGHGPWSHWWGRRSLAPLHRWTETPPAHIKQHCNKSSNY
jgi:hypothetical protein